MHSRAGYAAFRRDPLAALVAARDEGEVVRRRVGPLHVAVVTTHGAAREVLVDGAARTAKGLGLERARLLLGDGLLTAEGEVHARHHDVVRPALTRSAVEVHAPRVVARAGELSARVTHGAPVEVAAETGRLALEVAGDSLASGDLGDDAPGVAAALDVAMEFFDSPSLVVTDLAARLPLPAGRRFRRARRDLDAAVGRLVAARDAGGPRGGDLLDLVLAARDSGRLSPREVRDEVLTMLLAGHETVANALAWSLGLLARHPDAQARLHVELDRVTPGRPPALGDLPRLVWTRAVLLEALRLYPPAWLIGRRVTRPLTVRGRQLRPGSLVLVPVWALHRDPRVAPAPEAFRPDRFVPGGPALAPGAYLPFGAGPRRCIGQAFALQEGVLALAAIAGRARLTAVGPMPPPLARITLRPRGGMWLEAHPRSPTSPPTA